mgnify:CR=1 FL=1
MFDRYDAAYFAGVIAVALAYATLVYFIAPLFK